MLANPNSPETAVERQDVQAVARAISQQLIILDVNRDQETETAFATFVQRGAGALLCGAGAFFNSRRDRVVALAARYVVFTPGEFSKAEGLATCQSDSPPNLSF